MSQYGVIELDLPSLTPRYAPAPTDVTWPTTTWPRGELINQADLDRAVDEAFGDETLGVTNAVLVVRGGRVVAERYGGVQEFFDRPAELITADSPLLSWSMAKSVLHFLVGTLVDAGHLDPDEHAPVGPWCDPLDPRHRIRLRDLLAMRDGLDFHEAYELDQPSDVLTMLFGEGRHDVAAFAAGRPLAHEPGTVFNYSSGTSNILSGIVADVVGHGEAYLTYLRDVLFAPLGMTSATATLDDAGVMIASSYVHARAQDFARFGLLYLRGGEWDGRQLVSRAWIDTAQLPLSRDEESGHYYAWQWWVSADAYGTYWASGYEGQMISVVPALDAVVLRFGHTPTENYPALYQWRARLLDVLAASI